MKLQYLGTAASEGWPALFCRCSVCEEARKLGGKNIRTRSQSLVDEKLLIDFPADTYYHALTHDIDFSAIGEILITHSHEDHLYPMDLILKAPVYASKGKVPFIRVYGNEVVIEMIEQAMKVSNIADISQYVRPILLSAFHPVSIGEYTVTPLLADHIQNENCFIYLIEQGTTALLYAHDTGYFPEQTWKFLNGKRLSAVSLDCTFVLDHSRRNHLGLPEVVQIKDELTQKGIADEKTAFIINHFSHNCGKSQAQLEEAAKPYGVLVAYDGFTIECDNPKNEI